MKKNEDLWLNIFTICDILGSPEPSKERQDVVDWISLFENDNFPPETYSLWCFTDFDMTDVGEDGRPALRAAGYPRDFNAT